MTHTFKFFRGREILILWTPEGDGREFYANGLVEPAIRPLRAIWTPQMHEDMQAFRNMDAEAELTRIMSEQISRAIDDNIIETLIRRVNGGHNNNNADYLNFWLRMGENRA
jgi:hypothetical protein